MKTRLLWNLVVVTLFVGSEGFARQSKQLSRDEVAVIKKKLVAVLNALGTAPKGYRSEESNENYNLPTEVYQQPDGSMNLVNPSAHRDYEFKTAEDEQKEMTNKLRAAQAKGDMQEVMRLSQEMQQKMLAASAYADSTKPVRIDVYFNRSENETIDPDAVLFEGAGMIALKFKEGESEGNERIRMFFDPVTLKNTKELSKVDLNQGEGSRGKISSKTAVKYITVEMEGPITLVETWAKKFNTKTILSQID